MNKVKGYRAMFGYTQSEMAKCIGMSRRTYSNREKDGNFTLNQAKIITEIFKQKNPNITYEDIFLD